MKRTWAVVALAAALGAGACTGEPTTTETGSTPADEVVEGVDTPTPVSGGVTTTSGGSMPNGTSRGAESSDQGFARVTGSGVLEPEPTAEAPAAVDSAGDADDAQPGSPPGTADDGADDETDTDGPDETDVADIEQLLTEIDDLLTQIGGDLDGLDDDLTEVTEGLNHDEGDI